MKAAREYMTGEYEAPKIGPDFRLGKTEDFNLGELIHPVFAGAYRGVRDRSTVMEELPKTVGVAPESGAGLALGLAGEVATPDILDLIKFGDVAKTIVKKGGKTIKEGGENLVLKALRPSPSQVTKFQQKTGQSLSDFLTENKITGEFVDQAASRLQDLQSSFDDIAIKSGRKVPTNKVISKFNNVVDEFSGSPIPAVKKKAADVTQYLTNLVEKYGDEIDVADLTTERRAIDRLIKEPQYSLSPEAASYYLSVRHALQELVQDTTKGIKVGGKTLDELGSEIHKFIEFEKIAERQANLGKGAKVLGLVKSIITGTGAAAAGIPGAIAGYAGATIAESPKVISGVSRGLQTVGKGVEESKAGQKGLEWLMRLIKEGSLGVTR